MNAEHQALAEYLEARFNTRFDHIDERLDDLDRSMRNLTKHVDRKNDDQDEQHEDHEQRINSLESHYATN